MQDWAVKADNWLFYYSEECYLQLQVSQVTNVWDWKGPLEVIWSNSRVQARPPRIQCPGLCLSVFWVSPRMYLLVVREKRLCFSLHPLSLVLPLGTTEQSLDASFLHLPFRFYIYIWAFLPSRFSLPFLIKRVFQSLNHFHGSLLGSLLFVHISHTEPSTGPALVPEAFPPQL